MGERMTTRSEGEDFYRATKSYKITDLLLIISKGVIARLAI